VWERGMPGSSLDRVRFKETEPSVTLCWSWAFRSAGIFFERRGGMGRSNCLGFEPLGGSNQAALGVKAIMMEHGADHRGNGGSCGGGGCVGFQEGVFDYAWGSFE